MKLLFIALLVSISPSMAQGHFRLRRLDSDEDSYGNIQSDSGTSGCIEVKDDDPRDDQKLIFGDCEGAKSGWKFDTGAGNPTEGRSNPGMFHTELDPDMCMQAGRHGPVKEGEFGRLKRCNESEKLQKFIYINGGGIRPDSDHSLCLVWRGVNGDVNVDPLIFKKCDDVEDRVQWSGV